MRREARTQMSLTPNVSANKCLSKVRMFYVLEKIKPPPSRNDGGHSTRGEPMSLIL